MRWSWFHGGGRRGPLVAGLAAFLILEWLLPPAPMRRFPNLDKLQILNVNDNGTVIALKRSTGDGPLPSRPGRLHFLDPITGRQRDALTRASAAPESGEPAPGEELRSHSFYGCGRYLVEFQIRGDSTGLRQSQVLIRDPDTGTVVDRREMSGQYGLDADVFWWRGPDRVLRVTDLSAAGLPFPEFLFQKVLAAPVNGARDMSFDDILQHGFSHLSPDGRTLVEESGDRNTVRRAGEAKPRFTIPEGWCAFSRDSRQLALLGHWEPRVWGEDGYRRAWRLYDLATGACTSETWEKIPRIEDRDDLLHQIRFGRDNRAVVAFSKSRSSRLDIAQDLCRVTVWTPSRGELVSRFSEDGKGARLEGIQAEQSDELSLMAQEGLVVRDVESGMALHQLADDSEWIDDVSADERWIVIREQASGWAWLAIVQSWLSRSFAVSLPLPSGQESGVWKLGDSAPMLRLGTNSRHQVFSQNGKWFADGTDEAITVWRLPAGRPHGRAALGALLITALAWWRASRKRAKPQSQDSCGTASHRA